MYQNNTNTLVIGLDTWLQLLAWKKGPGGNSAPRPGVNCVGKFLKAKDCTFGHFQLLYKTCEKFLAPHKSKCTKTAPPLASNL